MRTFIPDLRCSESLSPSFLSAKNEGSRRDTETQRRFFLARSEDRKLLPLCVSASLRPPSSVCQVGTQNSILQSLPEHIKKAPYMGGGGGGGPRTCSNRHVLCGWAWDRRPDFMILLASPGTCDRFTSD